jgi:hypothetical protein
VAVERGREGRVMAIEIGLAIVAIVVMLERSRTGR